MIPIFVISLVVFGVGYVAVSRRGAKPAAQSVIEDGAVATLTGTVRGIGEPLVSPVGGKQCVAFRATGRMFKNGNNAAPNAPLFAPVELSAPALVHLSPLGGQRKLDGEISEVVMTPFTLVTRNGEIRVEGDVCTLPNRSAPIIPRKLELEIAFMKRAGLAGEVRDASFDEIVVSAGAKVTVTGTVNVASDGAIRLTGVAIDLP